MRIPFWGLISQPYVCINAPNRRGVGQSMDAIASVIWTLPRQSTASFWVLLNEPLVGTWVFLPGRLDVICVHIQIKILPYQFKPETTYKTYQDIVEHTSTSKD